MSDPPDDAAPYLGYWEDVRTRSGYPGVQLLHVLDELAQT